MCKYLCPRYACGHKDRTPDLSKTEQCQCRESINRLLGQGRLVQDLTVSILIFRCENLKTSYAYFQVRRLCDMCTPYGEEMQRELIEAAKKEAEEKQRQKV